MRRRRGGGGITLEFAGRRRAPAVTGPPAEPESTAASSAPCVQVIPSCKAIPLQHERPRQSRWSEWPFRPTGRDLTKHGNCPNKMRACLICFGFLCLGSLHEASKLRSWLGPDTFFEGILPSKRSYHGLVACDGKMYVFGGFEGEAPFLPFLSFRRLNTTDLLNSMHRITSSSIKKRIKANPIIFFVFLCIKDSLACHV